MKKMRMAAWFLAFAALTSCQNKSKESAETNTGTDSMASASAAMTDTMAGMNASTRTNGIDTTGDRTGTGSMNNNMDMRMENGKTYYGKSASHMGNSRINRPDTRRLPVNTLNKERSTNDMDNEVNTTLPVHTGSRTTTSERGAAGATYPIGVYNDNNLPGPSKAIGPRGLPNNVYTNDGRGGTYKGDTSEHYDGVNSVR